MSQIVLYLLHSILVLSFYIDVVFMLAIEDSLSKTCIAVKYLYLYLLGTEMIVHKKKCNKFSPRNLVRK